MRFFTTLIISGLYCVTLSAQEQVDMSLSPQQAKEIYAQYAANKNTDLDYAQKLPPHQLQADLKILKLVLEEAHTNIYNYSTKEEVDQAFNEAFAQAQDSLPYLGLVKMVSRIQKEIACGHSNWGHPAAYRKYRDQHIGLFPLDIEVINGKYYVKDNYTSILFSSTQILAINRIPVDSISTIMRKYMTPDGNSNAFNELELSKTFRNAYSNFIDNPEEFTITYFNDRNFHHITLSPLMRPALDSIVGIRKYGQEMGTPLIFSVDNKSSTAVYKIKWFNNEYIKEQGQEFISFTDSVFQQLADKNIKNLVIDLRGNVGGWTANGRHLFSYFINEQHPYIKRVRTKKYKDFSFAPLITDMPEYNDTMKLTMVDGLYEWQNNPNLIAYPASANRFKGNAFILTDGYTRSAASIFCALMKEHTKAKFIGEETGASRSIQGGMVMTVQLPYSHLLVNFSTARYDLAVSDHSSTGITPDHKIGRSLEATEEQYMQQVQNIIERSH